MQLDDIVGTGGPAFIVFAVGDFIDIAGVKIQPFPLRIFQRDLVAGTGPLLHLRDFRFRPEAVTGPVHPAIFHPQAHPWSGIGAGADAGEQ